MDNEVEESASSSDHAWNFMQGPRKDIKVKMKRATPNSPASKINLLVTVLHNVQSIYSCLDLVFTSVSHCVQIQAVQGWLLQRTMVVG